MKAEIANVHTVFNISTTLLLLPFEIELCKIVQHILPVQDDETDEMQTVYYQTRSMFVHITQMTKEIKFSLCSHKKTSL